MIRLYSHQPYLDFLALASRMDWLILTDTHGLATHQVNPYLPSKYADYRGSGTRIWGITEQGSVLDGEPLDALSRLGDHVGATQVLSSIINESTVTHVTG
jgi:hypothetical protein